MFYILSEFIEIENFIKLGKVYEYTIYNEKYMYNQFQKCHKSLKRK